MDAVLSPNRPADTQPVLNVQVTHRPPAPTLRYIDHVVGDFSPGFDFRYSQGVLTDMGVDVVHVLDTNLDVLLGTAGASGRQRLLATKVFVRNLRKNHIALVRTVLESDAPPSKGRADQKAREILDQATSMFVVLDENTHTPQTAGKRAIAHPHYRDRYVGYPAGTQVAGRMLSLTRSMLSPAAAALLGIVRVADTEAISLRLAGEASAELEASIASNSARHRAQISRRLERLSDGGCVQEIDSAELIVLPDAPRTLQDLQIVFLALSRDRPILTVRTTELTRLSAEVGPGWLYLVDGPITAEAVDTTFADLRNGARGEHANLDGRDLATTQAAYAEIFRAAHAKVTVAA